MVNAILASSVVVDAKFCAQRSKLINSLSATVRYDIDTKLDAGTGENCNYDHPLIPCGKTDGRCYEIWSFLEQNGVVTYSRGFFFDEACRCTAWS